MTETGRILQSYEDAGRANDCVPFLADSYEILCLMVGDLIVDKVRPGVLRKWHDCYERALDDLAAQGLALVQDEDSEYRRLQRQAAESPNPEAAAPPEIPGHAVASPSEAPEGFEPPDLGQLHELPPLTPLEGSPSHDIPEMPHSLGNATDAEESPFDSADFDAETGSFSEEAPDLAPPDLETHIETGDASLPEEPAAEPPEAIETTSPEPPVGTTGLDTESAEILDMLCDGLARIENDPEGARGTVFLAIDDGLNTLHQGAAQREWHGSLRACEAMSRLCEAAAAFDGQMGDRFFETAYAFGGVYGEAQDQADDDNLVNWVSECDALIEEWRAEPATAESPAGDSEELPFELPAMDDSSGNELEVEVPSLEESAMEITPPELPAETSASETGAEEASTALAPVETPQDSAVVVGPDEVVAGDETEPVQAGAEYVEISSAEPPAPAKRPEDDPATQFLETARLAMGTGASADAKLFAMQAAASIAQAQVKDAESRVRQAEIRLQETVKSIESARAHVKNAEVQVEDAEVHVEEGKENLADRGRHTHGVMGSLEGIRSRITDLDRRIQELQAQRDEASRQQSAAEEALNEARQQESETKEHLDALKNAEQMARVQLEDCRSQVKLLQRKQGEIEALMERARDTLTRYRESMADIDRTIELIRNAESGQTIEGDELLF